MRPGVATGVVGDQEPVELLQDQDRDQDQVRGAGAQGGGGAALVPLMRRLRLLVRFLGPGSAIWLR
jgi:hypothetical protein